MLDAAVDAISSLAGVTVVNRSSIWQTAPVGANSPQPDYFNAALAVQTSLPPEQLLGELLAIELRLGRVRHERNASRTIDLDILWREGAPVRRAESQWPAVEVPHPRLAARAFALIPLLEVVPDAADPLTGRLYAEILAEIGTEGVDPASF
jgi:2-amino-4-hydroxy-6-hydroxymethyldihydropteridine diphosphokinase